MVILDIYCHKLAFFRCLLYSINTNWGYAFADAYLGSRSNPALLYYNDIVAFIKQRRMEGSVKNEFFTNELVRFANIVLEGADSQA
ncbi:hypothetical protein D7V94_00410 [Parablautia intestinalis]|uniref:Uncharacterized protein n=1 Tax=Parablautia intestinalis TaxID=2320100 RepID=A0A3A9ARQ8_9FIRM|nr:hypothetical protein D7V94_00410 [Parablautia intestinalis]